MARILERDERGRFVKKKKDEQKAKEHPKDNTRTLKNDENDFGHQTLRTYNRIADGGHEYDIEDARKREVWIERCMKALWIILVAFLTWMLIGCKPKEIIRYMPVEKKVTEKVVVTDTLVEVKLVAYRDSIITKDSTSHLENPYAYSDASIVDGKLHHTLTSKSGEKAPAITPVTTIFITDSIPYPVEVPGPTEYIEREPSFLENLLMCAGGIFLLLVLVRVIGKRI